MESKILQPLSASREREPKRSGAVLGSSRVASRKQRLDAPYRVNASRQKSSPRVSTYAHSEDAIALKILLPNVQSGPLIGVKGECIKELKEITGANIHISGIHDYYPGTTNRVVYVAGSEDAVASAMSLIWDMIAHVTTQLSADHSVEWNPRQSTENVGVYDDVEVEATLTIPLAAAGLVLGRNGATIRAISEESGAKLNLSNIDDLESSLTKERLLFISGKTVECINCTSLVLAKLSEDYEVSQYTTKGTKYPSAVHAATAPVVPSFSRPKVTIGNSDRVVVMGNANMSPRRNSPPTMVLMNAAEPSSSVAETISASTTITLSVPRHLIGNIIGKEGAMLKEITSLSGAQVTISAK